MPRNEQLIRQHKLLQLLERTRSGQTIEELRDEVAKELGLASLHIKTVKRDLEALLAAGFDIESQHQAQRGKVWRLGPKTRQAYRIQASATELIALSLARDLLYPLAGTPFWHAIESFWNKLQGRAASVASGSTTSLSPSAVCPRLAGQELRAAAWDLECDLTGRSSNGALSQAEYQPPGKDPQDAADRAVRRRLLSGQLVHRRRGPRNSAGQDASAT